MKQRIYVTWDTAERNILRYDLKNGWTWDDYAAAEQMAQYLLEVTPHSAYRLLDATDVLTLPVDLVVRPRELLFVEQPRLRHTFILSNQSVTYTAFDLMLRFAPAGHTAAFTLFHTRQEVRNYLSASRT